MTPKAYLCIYITVLASINFFFALASQLVLSTELLRALPFGGELWCLLELTDSSTESCLEVAMLCFVVLEEGRSLNAALSSSRLTRRSFGEAGEWWEKANWVVAPSVFFWLDRVELAKLMPSLRRGLNSDASPLRKFLMKMKYMQGLIAALAWESQSRNVKTNSDTSQLQMTRKYQSKFKAWLGDLIV